MIGRHGRFTCQCVAWLEKFFREHLWFQWIGWGGAGFGQGEAGAGGPSRKRRYGSGAGSLNWAGRSSNGKNMERLHKLGQKFNVICNYWKMMVWPKANSLSPVPSFLFSKNGLWCFVSTCVRDAVSIDYRYFLKVI